MRLFIGFVLALSVVFAQPPATFRSDVRQVLVPVVVTDKQRRHVPDLKASDFHVFEHGVQQTIVALSSRTDGVNRLTEEDARDARASHIPANPPQSPVNSDAPLRTYLICLDTLHSSFANFDNVRGALTRLFKTEHDAGSQYALIALGRQIVVVQDSTRDAEKILAAIQSKRFLSTIQQSEASIMATDARQFTYSCGSLYCARCACDRNGTTLDASGCSDAKGQLRSYLTSSGGRTAVLNKNFLKGLTALVKATTSMPTTRTVVFISDGFNRFPGRELYAVMDGYGPKDRSFEFNPRDEQDQLQNVLAVALRYDVRFYTLDSRGAYTAGSAAGNSFDASFGGAATPDKVDGNAMTVAFENSSALEELARATGGVFFENNNDMSKGLQRAFADGRDYYVLVYRATNEALDGTFRKITVKVQNKKLVVSAKRGYWATKE